MADPKPTNPATPASGGNTGNSGNSSDSKEKEELDPKVKEAFELAAKELNIKVGFKGPYIYVDEECPPGTEEQLAKAKEECDTVNAEDAKRSK